MADNTINMEDLSFDEQKKNLNRFLENWSKPHKVNIDGSVKLKDEVHEYLNNWQAQTKEGLELRSRQVRETISILKSTFLEVEDINKLRPKDINLINRYIEVFNELSNRINIRLEKYANQLQGQPEQSQKPLKKVTVIKTYLWTIQPDKQLPKLYHRLIDGGFIAASQTSSEAFTATFSGQPVTDKTDKLKWLKSKALLAYFIDSIKNYISFTNYWQVAGFCFDKGSGLANTRNQYSNTNTGKPKGYQLIDEVLSDL